VRVDWGATRYSLHCCFTPGCLQSNCGFTQLSEPGTVTITVTAPIDFLALIGQADDGRPLDPNSEAARLCDGKTELPGSRQPDGTGLYCKVTACGNMLPSVQK
jgi:hypothetical protein